LAGTVAVLNRKLVCRAISVLLLAGTVAACAPARIDLDPRVREQLPSASVVHVVVFPAEPPPLMTAKAIATGSLFGPIGGGIAGARAAAVGKELMAKHNGEDLSAQLANTVADELKAMLPNLKRAPETPAGQGVDDLRQANLRPFVLDVKAGGIIMYYASNWARYRLTYNGRVRLVDTEQGRVLWQGVCNLKGADDPAQGPTLDELEAADGVAYRRLITETASACAAELLKQFHGQAPRE
jgi:hypothetical protein